MIGAAHFQAVVAGRQIGVGRVVPRSGLDPVVVESPELVAEFVVIGRGEVQRRELETHDALRRRHMQIAVARRQRQRWPSTCMLVTTTGAV